MFKGADPFSRERKSPEELQKEQEKAQNDESYQQSVRRARIKGAPIIAIAIIAGALFLFLSPIGKSLLRNDLFLKMIKIIFSFVIAVLAFTSKRNELKHPLIEKISCPLFFIITLIFALINYTKVYYFINYLACFLILIGTLVMFYMDSQIYALSLLSSLLGFVINFLGLQTLTYENPNTKVLWMVPLFTALTLLVVALIFCIIKLRPFKENKDKVIISLIAVPLFSYAIIYLGFSSLNYGLDGSTSIVLQFEVVNKRIETDSSDDDSTRYYIDFHNEEKDFSISVSNIRYDEYEIGDIVEFKKYNGFFKVPYYIIEE